MISLIFFSLSSRRNGEWEVVSGRFMAHPDESKNCPSSNAVLFPFVQPSILLHGAPVLEFDNTYAHTDMTRLRRASHRNTKTLDSHEMKGRVPSLFIHTT